MKKFAALSALALVSMLALSGCAGASSEPKEEPPVGSEQGVLVFYTVALPGEKAVDCVAGKFPSSKISPDCDWANVYAASSVAPEKSGSLKSYTVKSDDGREVLCVASKFSGNGISTDCNWSLESNR